MCDLIRLDMSLEELVGSNTSFRAASSLTFSTIIFEGPEERDYDVFVVLCASKSSFTICIDDFAPCLDCT